MTGATDFTKLVPGFDFLQGLLKNAGAGLPNMGQWIAPTLNPEEIEKRIEELRTVQFWLEQNARMLGATIQALEVQRMTLSTLKTMNMPMAELRRSMEMRVPGAGAEQPGKAAPATVPRPAPRTPAAESAPKAAAAATGPVDPLQWWGALTKQFTELAASALKESTADAARNLAGTMVKPSLDGADPARRKAAPAPAKAAVRPARAAAPRKRAKG
jgi:hypothetical protein